MVVSPPSITGAFYTTADDTERTTTTTDLARWTTNEGDARTTTEGLQ